MNNIWGKSLEKRAFKVKREHIRQAETHPHHEAYGVRKNRKTLELQRFLSSHSYYELHLYITLTSNDAKTNTEKDSAQ